MEKQLSPRSQAKRTAILDAAQSCFLDLGFSKTSMDTVAQRAAVSKATIYAHFPSKNDLFIAIIRRRCDDYQDGIRCLPIPTHADGRICVELIVGHLLRFLTQPEVLAMYRMVVAESTHQPDLAALYYEQGPMVGKARIAQMLQGLIDQGKLPGGNAVLMTECLTSMVRGEFFNRILLGLPQRDGFDFDCSVRLVTDVVMLMACHMVGE